MDNDCSAKDWRGDLVVEDSALKIYDSKTFNIEAVKLDDPLQFCRKPSISLAKFKNKGLDFVTIERDGGSDNFTMTVKPTKPTNLGYKTFGVNFTSEGDSSQPAYS